MKELELIKAILNMTSKEEGGSFLVKGKVYAVRTVTMIYTGRLVDVNSTELLLEDVAWIPETERWTDFADTGAHREAEPYKRPVVINRGAILDVTEISNAITGQK